MFLTFNYFQELTSLSDELLREGHTDEAYAVLTRAILNFPGETEGFLRLAKVCRRLGQPENALAHLHHALEIDPDFLVVYLELGDMHLSRGDRAQALMATRRAIEVFNAIPPDFPHPCSRPQ